MSCCDGDGVEHSVEVSAGSLYEAIGRALQVFRQHDWVGDVARNWILTVRARQPEVEHKVRVGDFENWLAAQGKSPAEESLKSQLRSLSEACGRPANGPRGDENKTKR